ncbi:flagellar biosynthetic protein FliR [Saccharococcus caldoxylosilyticus]|uniref:Flagellar biosynthetic protein FliR n=1 Tax=Parageobacillus caldoxylosilyticus NBRC 107762 TaxID=1220594 RepID=A0A023DC77_9BACL|nr:flagellar biosynthetic protein FliR [Parageobacillus caldoxylosilyticus]MBB3851415.1 flagellar biosynthetic protein FliR [Parageobacillus caldoxylosilyticus]BDG35156.1 flagellar biosynthetic protein FliR [Parageobacillus caldoxylosilyticus]BDG38931.1 flagellar biosynthetic protein FliR [Parageobacillus caldoxylosilyticus]BDG42731.1 flagellar biosynthetic protein FliR [Parageobacillus caldoxylosilyticus]GAJ38631.1 flagellar biosynthetic protein FliR [Parageobacillus caldoxylosilyticus NBRC 1
MEPLLLHFPAFLLVFVRVASFFATLPLFSYRTIPNVHKIGLSFFLSWIIFFAISQPTVAIDEMYVLLVLKEVLVGLGIGLFAYMIMAVVQIVGGLIDFQMGFAIANVIDPQTGAQSPLMGQYLYTFALLLLLSVNGHHLLLDGIFYSYQFIPLDQWPRFADSHVVPYIVKSFGMMFAIAFQMSVPLVGCLFLVDVALGIVARTVPQLNIFVVGFPVKIVVALILFIATMAALFIAVRHLFDVMFVSMRELMRLLGGT